MPESPSSAKANRTLGFVRRNLRGATHTAKAQAYISLVRPQLEYCSTIWSPHQQNLVHDLEMVQHRAARFVKNLYGQQSVTAMLRDLSWETLAQRRLKAQVTMTLCVTHSHMHYYAVTFSLINRTTSPVLSQAAFLKLPWPHVQTSRPTSYVTHSHMHHYA